MPENYDVVVVGGGVVGAACGRELARNGRRVAILDPGGARGQAWTASAGMLAPQIEGRQGDLLFELGMAGRELYSTLADSLREATGIDVGLWRGGSLSLAMNESEAEDLRSKVAWQRQQGHVCDWLGAAEVRERYPWVGRTTGALWAPHEGALDPVKLVEAFRADARAHGAQLIDDEAVSVDQRGDRILGVAGRRTRYPALDVVLAAGAWVRILRGLPRPMAVEPVRGQMLAMPWPEGVERAIVYHGDCYLLARGDEVIAGSTMENAGYDATVTSSGLGRILSAVVALCPPLGGLQVSRSWAGLRPMTPDGVPILGPEPRLPGLWYAAGYGRHGVLLAGITAMLLRLMMNGQTPTEDLTALRPDRFFDW
ncbi:MAG TPA: glycine oxidase ThiO [Gemmatimonadales bacterium]|nr:glycine oxidase ThiO [Gemmatimonadales bacterium]